ncbi:hypothetical protein HMPREF9123_2261 [Neisseria bacilliformis ATCC BAA-1200]|uniref:Uncharacterized protein n=1 Tax=Neisseria bacilliformis ATCC BAA-1200 TaxID=888742 RepID=F2BEV4_9NEIS|nr:hypothetical protein HMPREF9123_2261 [Neisseria bacilliformis ATCC BAA-1200]
MVLGHFVSFRGWRPSESFSDGLWFAGRDRVRGLRNTPCLNGGGRLKIKF